MGPQPPARTILYNLIYQLKKKSSTNGQKFHSIEEIKTSMVAQSDKKAQLSTTKKNLENKYGRIPNLEKKSA